MPSENALSKNNNNQQITSSESTTSTVNNGPNYFSFLPFDIIFKIFMYLPVRSEYIQILHNIFEKNNPQLNDYFKYYWRQKLARDFNLIKKIDQIKELKEKQSKKALNWSESKKLERLLAKFPSNRYTSLSDYSSIYKTHLAENSNLYPEATITLYSQLRLSALLQHWEKVNETLSESNFQSFTGQINKTTSPEIYIFLKLACKYQLTPILDNFYKTYVKPSAEKDQYLSYLDIHQLTWAIYCDQMLSEIKLICINIFKQYSPNTISSSEKIKSLITIGFLGTCALNQAIKNGREDIINYLITEHKLDFSYLPIIDELELLHPLLTAIRHRKIPIANMIIDGGTNLSIMMEIDNDFDEDALSLARAKGLITVVKKIVEKNKNEKKYDDLFACDLYKTIALNNFDLFKYIIEIEGANVNTPICDDLSIFHMACTYARFEMVEYLINKGININQKNENNVTPLHALMLDRGEIIFSFKISSRKCMDSRKTIEARLKILILLLKNGADFRVRHHSSYAKHSVTARDIAENHKLMILAKWLQHVEIFSDKANDIRKANVHDGLIKLQNFYRTNPLYKQEDAKKAFEDLFNKIISNYSTNSNHLESFQIIISIVPTLKSNLGFMKDLFFLLDFFKTFVTPNMKYHLTLANSFGTKNNYFKSVHSVDISDANTSPSPAHFFYTKNI